MKRIVKTKQWIALGIGALVISCSQPSEIDKTLADLSIHPANYTKVDSSFYPDKRLQSLRLHEKPGAFTQVTFYESGKKKALLRSVNEQLHGEQLDWYENGQLKWKRDFASGKGTGHSALYFEDGQIEKEFDFAKATLKWYYPNGNVREIQQEGDSFELQTFYQSGTPYEHIVLNADGVEVNTYYHEKGEKVFQGERIQRKMYQNGQLFTGTIRCEFSNGKTAFEAQYVNGLREGKLISHYGDGTLQSEGLYDKGKELHFTYYYPNGQKEYSRDAQTKKTKRWDTKGKFLGEN